MRLYKDVSLKKWHTFHVEVKARYLAELHDFSDFLILRENREITSGGYLILGGGSNVLFTDDYKGCVGINCIKGIEILDRDEKYAYVRVASGEIWHDFVMWCLENNLGGVENLALIPGRVGAAPMQNIGAYGVEVSAVIEHVEGINEEGKSVVLSNKECFFGYRDSIFKKELKNRFFITHVVFRLTHCLHVIHAGYASLKEELRKRKIENPDIRDIAEAVIDIRRSKLPDPEEWGNAGSFFKNPVLQRDQYEEFVSRFPDAPAYPSGESGKVPAAWLIERAGFKGKTWKGAAVHEKQPLVLINRGTARGHEILELARQIQEKVWEMFGIMLDPEVNIIS